MTIANSPTIKHFPCPGCGAKLEFNPKAKQLKCPYCGREEVIPQSAEEIQERSYEDYLKVNRSQTVKLSETALEASCPGCRARVILSHQIQQGNVPFVERALLPRRNPLIPLSLPKQCCPLK